MIVLSLSLALVAFLISLPLTGLLVWVSRRRGWLDAVGAEGHKLHVQPTPNVGGVAIFTAVAMPMALAMLAVWLVPDAQWQRFAPDISIHLPGLRAMTAVGGGVLTGMALLHLVGLLDDRRSLGPMIKLTAQTAVALGLVVLADMRVLTLLDVYGVPGTALSIVLATTWIVVIVNAFNFLDNMDGLSAGVAAIIAALYLVATIIGGQWFVAGLAALLLGALVGFLVWNFPPAKIFMGDAGSLVVGLTLAVISIRTTYFDTDTLQPEAGRAWYGLLMPLVVMAVPLYDFVSVTVVRVAQGRSPFVGDHSHFSHRLVKLGLSRRRAVGVIWLCTLATALGGVMLGSLATWQVLLVAAQVAAVLALLAVLEHGTAKRRGEV
ncbi:glycosyltransferase family 4 protein [Phycisphaerales bacterium AB-hyl4]|uniref:Glycosyltransferase family 4 protein n=1 Tax=Natronomicrosphaera hydrolytica TaxID=3242702 RepID=A0ABV4U799_9BACT